MSYASPAPVNGARPLPPYNPKAARLVSISQWLGWGGIALLFVGGPVVGILVAQVIDDRRDLTSVYVGAAVSTLGAISTVIGAVVGQIGRGMQGRVV
jgi:hypothetical protein